MGFKDGFVWGAATASYQVEGAVTEGGREAGILSGANVVMPNLSPAGVRKKYMLYDNKLSSGSEAAESLELLRESLSKIGYGIAVSRGDSLVI
jgi:biotin synthase